MMTLDELLNKKITIKEGINMGIISSKVMADFDLWSRVNTVMEKESVLKSHAVERVAESCRVCEDTVWKSYSATIKIIRVV